MRLLRVTLGLVAIGATTSILAPGCRDATQATLEISLAKRALCTETNGTAITVGVDALETERRVTNEYVTAATSSCDETTRSIGTLVLTPGDEGHASVIVVVAYGGVSPSSCKPPDYKGCIVARRQFAFSDHRHLRMPVTIDPDCRDVPCDAFSTCRSGKCFESKSSCDGDTCTEPGDPGDGGTSDAGQVIPDTGIPGDGGSTDGALPDAANDSSMPEAGEDAGGSDGGATLPYCNSMILHCRGAGMADTPCGTTANTCCDNVLPGECNPATCSGDRYCCIQSDCPTGTCTGATPTTPGRCTASGGAGVTCNGVALSCPATKGGASVSCAPGTSLACCEEADGQPYCYLGGACPINPSARYCCQQSDCGMGEICGKSPMPNAVKICTKSIVGGM